MRVMWDLDCRGEKRRVWCGAVAVRVMQWFCLVLYIFLQDSWVENG